MRLGPKVGRARRHANLQGIPLQANGLPACTPFCNGVQARTPICSWRADWRARGGLACTYQPPINSHTPAHDDYYGYKRTTRILGKEASKNHIQKNQNSYLTIPVPPCRPVLLPSPSLLQPSSGTEPKHRRVVAPEDIVD
ncbi:hypothetical protein PGTUg99_015200 [Puccinia graminis f. sp. tritici]|uniref:Uncharacterized protein n=1 Tax=Puccinia graminis f. sp. tritici TaxID=56615 RepID=A0A5B0Q8N4_PUCGR|nr:hypothetical protein PGTUg99_015200 [Puccinia graminis f. sp. tritici]